MANASPKLTSVRLGDLPDVATLKVDIDTQRLTAYGLSNNDVNNTLSTAWGGRYVNDFIDKGRVKRVYVQGDAPYRARPEDLGRSEEHTSELQSLMRISYAVFRLKKKKKNQSQN